MRFCDDCLTVFMDFCLCDLSGVIADHGDAARGWLRVGFTPEDMQSAHAILYSYGEDAAEAADEAFFFGVRWN
jgi:hypothetical protein